ncbi:hypothetical protein E4U43_008045 [Claviceps pusilla]|uniref:Peptidase S1 domain-containing protein n=1 Tax=Claviceps pusilla TaxID=123648 RepID=A0A9P7T010_9HYPO|nr:hypothetical protein E4U43_008045 [Claviceps pusilla]
MRSIAPLVVLVSSLLGGILPAAAIIGGEIVRWEEHPYIVSFLADGEPAHHDGPEPPDKPVVGQVYKCSGLLLPKNVVVTAASCVWDLDVKKARVAIGPPDNRTFHAIGRVEWYHGYLHHPWRHDFAVLNIHGEHGVRQFVKLRRYRPARDDELLLVASQVARKRTKTDPNVTLANLDPTAPPALRDPTEPWLRRLTVQVVPLRRCWKKFKKHRVLEPTRCCIAAWFPLEMVHSERPTWVKDSGVSTSSDTGTPLILDNVAVGILSFMSPEADLEEIQHHPYRGVINMGEHYEAVNNFYDEYTHYTGFRDHIADYW